MPLPSVDLEGSRPPETVRNRRSSLTVEDDTNLSSDSHYLSQPLTQILVPQPATTSSKQYTSEGGMSALPLNSTSPVDTISLTATLGKSEEFTIASPSPVHLSPSTASGRNRTEYFLDCKNPHPSPPRVILSTASLSSLQSLRSTSSNSPLYMFKKPPMGLKLPFSDELALQAEISEFMRINAEREKSRERDSLMKNTFRVSWLVLMACIAYFLFVGVPLWDGVVYKCWKLATSSHISKFGLLGFLLWGGLLAWLPLLLCTFEGEVDDPETRDASETCLIIPAYKAAGAIRDTLPHALKIFKPRQIFVIANGNSPTPLDDTEGVCKELGVNHFWVPVGSKIVAEFVGVYLAKGYRYCMLIDDDVHLPPNLPIVSDRIKGNTACVGYTIKSTGANGSPGTVFQQAQDVEYKLAGISKVFQSKFGSSTFPHGAIILWDRNILEKLFFGHPGYHISEDWYFGHTCRSAGFRVKFCSQVFVETETPPCLFIPNESSRGGYGEMTIWKQRFYRWNFFFVYRLINDIPYLLFAWKLGWHEFVTKIFVFAEVYETLLYIARPFILPIMIIADWSMTLGATAILLGLYIFGFMFFNFFHLRRKNEMIAWKILPVYFSMKMALMVVNTASVYYSLYAYATFFSVKHSRVVENQNALEAVKALLEDYKGSAQRAPAEEKFLV